MHLVVKLFLAFTNNYLNVLLQENIAVDGILKDDAVGQGGHIVFVGVDGVQHPHLTFPPGDNVFTFLGINGRVENGSFRKWKFVLKPH